MSNSKEDFGFNSNGPRPKPTRLPPQKWERIRADYIAGEGSLRDLAGRHGVRLSTLEARCRRERWVELRQQRESVALKTTVGTPVASLNPAPVEDAKWWEQRDKEHLLSNLDVLGKLRAAAQEKVAGASAVELERLAGAVAAIASTERELLELTPRSSKHKAPSLRPSVSKYPCVRPIDMFDEGWHRKEEFENEPPKPTDHEFV